MLVIVGSANDVKIEAVRETLQEFGFSDINVIGKRVTSPLTEQPFNLEYTVEGAKGRAQWAYKQDTHCTYGVGIESGVIIIPPLGLFNISACVFYNHKGHNLGLTSAFHIPEDIAELMTRKNIPLDQAVYEAGYSVHQHIGNKGGLIKLLTLGKQTRKDLLKQGVFQAVTALPEIRAKTQEQTLLL